MKIISFRVYSTNDYFRDSRKKQKIQQFEPIFIENFPDKDCKLKIYFGKVPSEIIKIKNSIDAFGLMSLGIISNELDSSKTGPEQFNDCVKKIESDSTIFTKYEWYTTIALEKEITVSQSKIIDKSGILDTKEALAYLKEFDTIIPVAQIFDKILLSLMIEFKFTFFSNLMFTHKAIVTDNNEVIGDPNISLSANASVISVKDSIDQEKITSSIKKINCPEYEWLDIVAYWRRAMIEEKDKWKKFYFGFIALELLINQSFKKIYKSEKNDFQCYIKNSNKFNQQTKDRILNEKKAPSIGVKFEYIFCKTCQRNNLLDSSDFKELNKIRVDMSHGHHFKNEDLNIGKLENLLNQCLMGILTM